MLNQSDLHDSHLKFIGFSPSHREKLLTKQKLWDLSERGPSDSAVYLRIRKKKGRFKAFLELKALRISFRASGQSSDLDTAVDEAISWIETQLDRWKKKRWEKKHPDKIKKMADISKYHRLQYPSEIQTFSAKARPRAG